MQAVRRAESRSLSGGFLLRSLDRRDEDHSGARFIRSTPRNNELKIGSGFTQGGYCGSQTARPISDFPCPDIDFLDRIRHDLVLLPEFRLSPLCTDIQSRNYGNSTRVRVVSREALLVVSSADFRDNTRHSVCMPLSILCPRHILSRSYHRAAESVKNRQNLPLARFSTALRYGMVTFFSQR